MTELDELVRRLDGPDEAERIYAAEDLGCANLAEGVAPLFARLQAEPSRAVREAIFAALQGIEDDTVTEGSIGLLASEDAFLRNQAVELLRQRGAGAIPFLQGAFPCSEKDQRKMIVDVLAGVDGPGSAEIYSQALADSDVNVVITAVESLGNAGKIEFRRRIEQLAATANPMLAGACLETLAQIGDAQSLEAIRSGTGVGGPVADFLLPSYLKVLGAYGDECAIVEAAGLLNSCGAHLQASLVDAITTLRRRHPSAPLPQSLVEPLQNIARTGNSTRLRRQAVGLLGGLAQFNGVAAFLAGRRESSDV